MPRAVRILAVVALVATALGVARRREQLTVELEALGLARAHASVMRTATEEATARERVRLALARARAVPFDSAPPHLALALADGQLTLERGAVVLRAMPLVARGSVGVWSLVSVDSTGLQLEAEHLDLPVADRVALGLVLRPGHRVYVH